MVKFWRCHTFYYSLKKNVLHGSKKYSFRADLVNLVKSQKCYISYIVRNNIFTPRRHILLFANGQKLFFGGKLRNPSFCHIVGMKRPTIFFKGRYKLDLGFKIGLNEKLTRCKHVYLIKLFNLSSFRVLNFLI